MFSFSLSVSGWMTLIHIGPNRNAQIQSELQTETKQPGWDWSQVTQRLCLHESELEQIPHPIFLPFLMKRSLFLSHYHIHHFYNTISITLGCDTFLIAKKAYCITTMSSYRDFKRCVPWSKQQRLNEKGNKWKAD